MTEVLPWIVAAAVAIAWCVVAFRPRGQADASGAGVPRDDGPESELAARRRDSLLQLAGLAIAAAVWFLGERPGLAFAVGALWTGAVLTLRRRRQERARLDDESAALEAIAATSRALKAGIPMSGIFAILASEGRGVAGRSFQEIVRRESLGEDLGSALRRVLVGSPVAPLRALGLALLVHGSAGGNLAETTDRLARSLVERSRVRRRARTITGYARTAGMLLAVMPIVVVTVLCASVHGYSEYIFERPQGNLLVGISAALVMLGVLSMQRIGRIEQAAGGLTR